MGNISFTNTFERLPHLLPQPISIPPVLFFPELWLHNGYAKKMFCPTSTLQPNPWVKCLILGRRIWPWNHRFFTGKPCFLNIAISVLETSSLASASLSDFSLSRAYIELSKRWTLPLHLPSPYASQLEDSPLQLNMIRWWRVHNRRVKYRVMPTRG